METLLGKVVLYSLSPMSTPGGLRPGDESRGRGLPASRKLEDTYLGALAQWAVRSVDDTRENI